MHIHQKDEGKLDRLANYGRKRVFRIVMAAWFLLCLPWFNASPPHYAFAAINLLFGIGMVAALLYKHVPTPRLLMVLGALGFFGVGMEFVYFNVLPVDTRVIAFGLMAGLGVAGAVKSNPRCPRWLTLLGTPLTHYT
jgi:hypothetical protein